MEKIQNEPLNPCEEVLAHHGILGMKWGVRRYQNKDGSLTSLGRKHYGVEKQSKGFWTNVYNPQQLDHDYNALSDTEFKTKYGASKGAIKRYVRAQHVVTRGARMVEEAAIPITVAAEKAKYKAKTYKDKINNYVNHINQQALETHLRDVRTHEEMTRQANQQALEDHLRAVNAHEEMVRQVNQQNQLIQMQQMMMPPMFF